MQSIQSAPEFGKSHPPRSPKSRRNSDAKLYRLPETALRRSVEEFFIALDTPLSLSCYMLYVAGENEQLVRKEIDPHSYICASRFRDDFAAVSFLRKADFLNTGIDTKQVALDNFELAEQQCRTTNRRFTNLALDPSFSGPNVWLLHSLTRKIARVLGEFESCEFFEHGSWGPGVTASVKGSDVSASRKFRDERGVTEQLYPLISSSFGLAYPHWFEGLRRRGLDVVKGNSIITVAKNAKTDRTIGIEPGINSWFQLSMGRILRRKLFRAGFNLNSDIKNQRGALQGSLTGQLATVDFSAASDTIAYEVAREILPLRWFTVLDACRSHYYTASDTTTKYEKFSAMGCGFTFELESIIFVQAALAVCEYLGIVVDDVSVYGDDIILPTQAFSLYRSFCEFLGFTINQKKSFASGPFRESCGSYYFNGVDVKPIFVKSAPSTLRSVFNYANQIRLFAHRQCYELACDKRFQPIWLYLVRMIPSSLRLLGPRSLGEAVIHENMDCCRFKRPLYYIEGYLVLGAAVSSVSIYKEDHGVNIAALWRTTEGIGNDIPLRGVVRQKIKTLFAPRWYDYGTWV